ncbi:hypothetical protein M409DRAFT_20507 [Zasmidium cellare ATCC 36951]|uniref:Uncharacterized protein n=1 Tax=Zasmidium cellare ATCC 36951 TaxID=1080233 RepID=A0A6A6CQD6_ZASCE|nr:uncharacterized protein M409DRAFT_20507 [Zasmidium cellare ATCC 36951]KAF2169281.1 hypothetical protein M409DRAFT_20507 [Zasmidium cellare ATCC 36951]
MTRLKTLHAALGLLIGVMATLSSAAPPYMSFSFWPMNTSSGVHAQPTSTIHSHTWTLNSSLSFHTSPTGTTRSQTTISRVTSGGGQEVTFQLDYNFAGHQLGSSFGLGQDACIEGFTHALSYCDDKDGNLFQNGLVHASVQAVPVTFLTFVVESGSEKRSVRSEAREALEQQGPCHGDGVGRGF